MKVLALVISDKEETLRKDYIEILYGNDQADTIHRFPKWAISRGAMNVTSLIIFVFNTYVPIHFFLC